MEEDGQVCAKINGTVDSKCLASTNNGTSNISSAEELLSSVTLAFCCGAAAMLMICIYCLNRPTFNRHKLGCLLILRWNCAADIACLLNKVTFMLVNRNYKSLEGNQHVLAWVCKLYHIGESLTMNVQTLLLVLFALERGAIAIDLRFGLKHFSQFRLKIGVVLAAVLILAAHLNYIWMYNIGANYISLDRNNTNWETIYECRVTAEFLVIYNIVAIIDLVVYLYAPILVCGISAGIVINCWIRNGLERPSVVFGKTKSSNNGNASQSHAGVLNSLDWLHRNMKVLQLIISLVCYLPLATTGLIRAVSIHHQLPVDEKLYLIMNYILQPMKNVLCALATTAFVVHHLVATRQRKAKRSRCQKAKNQSEEECIPMRVIG